MSTFSLAGEPLLQRAGAVVDEGRQWLSQLAQLDSARRLYALDIENVAASLAVEGFVAGEALSQLYELQVLVLSTDALIDLDALLWKPARLWMTHSDGLRQPRSGFVREAAALESDGGLARYRLTLVPWLWLTTQQTHSRIYQQQSVLDIIEQLLQAYVPQAEWRLDEGLRSFLQTVPARVICTQYRETDHDFLLRLLREEGLGYYFEESSSPEGHAIAGQCLVLFSDSSRFAEDRASQSSLGGRGIRFHRHSSQQDQDSVQSLRALQQLPGGAVTAAAWDPQTKRVIAASLGARATGTAASVTPALERYLWAGHGCRASTADVERTVRLSQEAAEAAHQRFEGEATVRSFRPGRRFVLTDSPEDPTGFARHALNPSGPQAEGIDAAQRSHFTLTAVQSVGINNLPVAVAQSVTSLLGSTTAMGLRHCTVKTDSSADAGWLGLIESASVQGFSCRFQAQRAAVPWRPQGAGERRGARAEGPQSARVVGVNHSGGELCRDAQGRIQLRFHWQRGETPQDQSSGWVRLAQRHAGSGMGCSFIPRIGQEVLVGFIDNDMDQAVVLGALYNGRGEGGEPVTPGGVTTAGRRSDLFAQAHDQRASAQGNHSGGNAPAWHGASADAEGHRNAAGLTGIKTRELGGSGHNQLQLDDHDGELRSQLASTQATSQLNLGHLIHTADNYRGSVRGSGFELRSDQSTALRGGAGVLISTWHDASPAPAREPMGEITGPLALLNQAQGLSKAFDDASRFHQTIGLSSQRGSVSSNASALTAQAAPLAAIVKVASGMVDADHDAQALADAANSLQAAAPRGGIPHLGRPMVVAAGRAGLGLVAAESIQIASGDSTLLAAGGDLNLASAQQLTLHGGQAIGLLAGAAQAGEEGRGLSLIAAQGPISIQAQNDQLNLDSRKALQIASSNASVDLTAATAIKLATAGGASIEIEGGNITVQCPGTLTIHAAQHRFAGPTQLSREMNDWPVTRFDERIKIVYGNGEPARSYRYEITREDGALISGVTDDQGWTTLQKAVGIEELTIKLLGPVSKGGT